MWCEYCRLFKCVVVKFSDVRSGFLRRSTDFKTFKMLNKEIELVVSDLNYLHSPCQACFKVPRYSDLNISANVIFTRNYVARLHSFLMYLERKGILVSLLVAI